MFPTPYFSINKTIKIKYLLTKAFKLSKQSNKKDEVEKKEQGKG